MEISKVLVGSLVLIAGALSPTLVRAEEVKVATVDMQKAIQTVEAGKKAKTQLENELNKRRQELQSEEASVKKMVEEFKKQSVAMSDDARNKKQSAIQERMMKLQEMHAKSQGELQKKEQELTQPIVARLKSIIADVAKSKGYKVVLEKNENTVLYSEEKDDLTSEVIEKFNKSGKS